MKDAAVTVLGFAAMLAALAAWFLLNGSPGYKEPDHGSTAVCNDGTVLEPPWNSCGGEHDHLDHWTTAPSPRPGSSTATITPETPTVEAEPSVGPTPDICVDAHTRGVVPRDRWTPCGQLLGYFDDWATPPGAPAFPH
ncbi:hypothetical protein [Streptomyces peucetius]|uniref:Secreted protein n=1 Tax=Streptomyces peucetius TaxID=1950 RepID=A0ABY6I7V4_STRPE|nr:hypothetical protein [Streptomyces peucetius]UYQ63074.1 hypothetical protein OGH68_17325 [Streptomyces peucetius]